MYFTNGKRRAFELLMQQKPGFDRFQSGCTGSDEDCCTCRFYRPQWNFLSSSFDVTDKVVVDVDVPFLVVVHRIFLTDLNFLDEPHECGAVQFLQIVVVLHHVQPCVYGLLVLPAGGKLLCQLPSALLFCLPLGLVAIEKLHAEVFRDFAQHLVLVGGLHQTVKLRQPPVDGAQFRLECLEFFPSGRLLLRENFFSQLFPAVLRPYRLAADVRQYDLRQHLLVDVVGRTGIFAARGIPVADIRFELRFLVRHLFTVIPHIPHGRTAVHAPEQTTEQRDGTAFTAAPSGRMVVHPLHGVPHILRDQRLVGVLHPNPLAFRFADLLVVFVGDGACLVLYHVAEIHLIAKDGFHRHIIPERRFAPVILPSLRHVVKGSGRGDFFRVENQGNFAETIALQPQVKDVPHYRSGHRINLQNVLVRRTLPVAEGSVAAHIFPSLEGGQLHRLDFVAGVPGIEVVHYIFQNDHHFIVLADGVHTIVESDEAAAERWKNEVGIFARFNVITTEPAEVFG